MSKHNKVNPGMYTQAGRLSPDDIARERQKQVDAASTRRMEGKPPSYTKATPSGESAADAADAEPADQSEDQSETEDDEK